MIRRRLALVVLLLFVAGLTMSTTGKAAPSAPCNDELSHCDNVPNPDTDNDDHSCGPTCSCSCCPGHGVWVTFFDQHLLLAFASSNKVAISFRDDLNPRNTLKSIFHPPRT